jgi:hypothetical protein
MLNYTSAGAYCSRGTQGGKGCPQRGNLTLSKSLIEIFPSRAFLQPIIDTQAMTLAGYPTKALQDPLESILGIFQEAGIPVSILPSPFRGEYILRNGN